MPGDRSILQLDEASACTLGVVLEDILDLAHPVHVECLRQVRPALFTGLADEAAVLGAEANVLEMTEMLIEEGPISS